MLGVNAGNKHSGDFPIMVKQYMDYSISHPELSSGQIAAIVFKNSDSVEEMNGNSEYCQGYLDAVGVDY